jgi:hypothetical protein
MHMNYTGKIIFEIYLLAECALHGSPFNFMSKTADCGSERI